MHKHFLSSLGAVIALSLIIVASAFAAAPSNTTPPVRQRHAEGRPDAHGLERHVDRQPDQLRLPVAALHELDVVQRHREREREQLRRARRRRRQDRARGRDGVERRRSLDGELEP